jgi:hypothetical protein
MVEPLVAADFNGAETPTFYWIKPGTYQVTFQYTLSDGTSASAATSFNIEGPTQPNVTVTEGQVLIGNGAMFDDLHFAGLPNTSAELQYGISFSPGGNPPTDYAKPPAHFMGSFSWAQLIVHYEWSVTRGVVNQTCIGNVGLDGSYTYAARVPGSTTIPDDAPYLELEKKLGIPDIVTWEFGADMYLLWTANVPGAIPVPLGHIPWSFSATAEGKGAKLRSLIRSDVPPAAFQASTDYPPWGGLASGGQLTSGGDCPQL